MGPGTQPHKQSACYHWAHTAAKSNIYVLKWLWHAVRMIVRIRFPAWHWHPIGIGAIRGLWHETARGGRPRATAWSGDSPGAAARDCVTAQPKNDSAAGRVSGQCRRTDAPEHPDRMKEPTSACKCSHFPPCALNGEKMSGCTRLVPAPSKHSKQRWQRRGRLVIQWGITTVAWRTWREFTEHCRSASV